MTLSLIYLVGAVIVVLFIKWVTPIITGKIGEFFVAFRLSFLDQKHYKIINDLWLSSNGNTKTTQIDHVVVSNFGIFCIETKTYKGWIFGNPYDNYWTQVIYRYKNRFYNPIHQNYAHVQALKSLLGSNVEIVSFVVFIGTDKLRVNSPEVGRIGDLVRMIGGYKNSLFSDSERDRICELLRSSNIQDRKLRREHNREVRSLNYD